MDFKNVIKNASISISRKDLLIVVGLGAFLAIGVAQQKYKKVQDQKAYEAECAAHATSKVASPCASPTRPGIPLPARGN